MYIDGLETVHHWYPQCDKCMYIYFLTVYQFISIDGYVAQCPHGKPRFTPHVVQFVPNLLPYVVPIDPGAKPPMTLNDAPAVPSPNFVNTV